MIDEKHVVAINKEIDGANTPEESARLNDLLTADEEARVYFEDLAKLRSMLSGVEAVDPPATLKTNIMKAIHGKQTAATTTPVVTRSPANEPWRDMVRKGFLQPSRWAFGFSFAAGIAFGILGYAAFGDALDPTGLDSDPRFSGTMAPYVASSPVDKIEFDEVGITGHIETRSASDQFFTKIDVNSEKDLEIEIAFDGKVLSPIGFQQEIPGDAEITLSPGELRLSHHGKNVYVFTLGYPAMTTSEVHVRFYSGGLLFEKTLNTLNEGP